MSESLFSGGESVQNWENQKVLRELRRTVRTGRLARESLSKGAVDLGSERLQAGDELWIFMQSRLDGVPVNEDRAIYGKLAYPARRQIDVEFDSGWYFDTNYEGMLINLGTLSDQCAAGILERYQFEKPLLLGSLLQRGGTVAIDELGLGFKPATTRYLLAQYTGVSVNGQRVM